MDVSRSRANSACATCSKARCARADSVRVTAQLIDAMPACISGRSASMGRSRIFSICRTGWPGGLWGAGAEAGADRDRRAKRKPTDSLGAYEYYLRGMAAIYRFTIREANVEALQLFMRAIGSIRICDRIRLGGLLLRQGQTNRWPTDDSHGICETDRLARHAVRLGSDDAVALATGAGALAYVVRDLDAGAACIDQALRSILI